MLTYALLRELLKKKMQITSGLLPKGGGGSEAIQKFWDTFCAPTRGGGGPNPKVFGPFLP